MKFPFHVTIEPT